MIRPAADEDIDSINQIYLKIHDAEESGRAVIGWLREVYPVRQTAKDAVLRKDMYVEEDEQRRIVASGIINQIQVPEYADCAWKYPASPGEVMVLHTLVVDPDFSGHGYGTRFVRYYENFAVNHGCRYLRMDTNEKNHAARMMYKKMGYSEPGIVNCVFNGIPDVRLVCLEKLQQLCRN